MKNGKVTLLAVATMAAVALTAQGPRDTNRIKGII